MYIHTSELIGAGVIYGFLWRVIPWLHLSVPAGIVAAVSLLAVSFVIVELIEVIASYLAVLITEVVFAVKKLAIRIVEGL